MSTVPKLTDSEVTEFAKRELPQMGQAALETAQELVRGDHSEWTHLHALLFAAFVVNLTEALLASGADNIEASMTELQDQTDQVLRLLRASGTVIRAHRAVHSKGGSA